MFISIMILIVAIALPSINRNISPNLYLRISSLLLLYTGALAFNAFYIQSIGSGIGIYSGLFQVTVVSQLLDTFIFIIASFILISWPSITNSNVPHLIDTFTFKKENTNTNIELNLNNHHYASQYSLIILFIKQKITSLATRKYNLAMPSNHNSLNNNNQKHNINNLFKGNRSFSTSSLNFNNKNYAEKQLRKN